MVVGDNQDSSKSNSVILTRPIFQFIIGTYGEQ